MTELGIYLGWKKDPSKMAYNLPFLLPLPEGTDIDRLCAALRKTVAAHRGLLARFKQADNGSLVRIMPKGDPEAIVKIEVRDDDPEWGELVRPFEDTEGDLYRIVILKGDKQGWLFMDIHHILFDGTSMRIFIKDLNLAYKGEELRGEVFTASDAAKKEQELRATPAFKEALEYYTALLGDGEYNSALIHDKEGSDQKCAYHEHALLVDAGAVADFCGSLGIRVSTFFAGAYGYTLGRFSGSKNALYATVHSARNDENSNTVGMFVRTFPVVQDFANDEPVKDHLKKLDEQITDSRKSDACSFVDINDKLSPNIPTLFAYQGEMFKEIDFLGGRTVTDAIPTGDPQEDMVTEVIRDKGRYILRAAYRRDLYEHSSIGQFVNSYEKVLNEFLNKDSLKDVDMVTGDQLKELDGFLPDPVPAVKSLNIVSMFREAASVHPESVALIIGDIKRTYKDMDGITDRISSYLIDKKIGRKNVVAILIHRNEYMISASLGVLKSGAAYLPLDPSYPPDRLNFMVKDAGASFLIADRDLADIIDGFDGKLLLTDDIPALPPVREGRIPPVPDGEDLFTLLYTSGSTGTPKGVMLKHGNIANFCSHYTSEFNMDDNTVCAAYASYGFDANMMDMYPALTVGACICVVPEEMRMDLKVLGSYLSDNNVSIAFMTTQVGRQFAQSPYRPSCLKKLLVGGERLASVTVPEGFELINVYGPTECTIFVTERSVDQDREYLRIPIGRPFAGTALYVVDENGKRLPPCVPGELWAAGPCVAAGYLNRPEKDAESFTVNPFSSSPGYERLYHTGDIVRFLPDGEIDYIGRNDGQVKIRGFRIELSEIESVIRDHPGIEDVTVQAFDNKNGSGKYLAAYIVEKEDGCIKKGEIESFVRKVKPPYMVPAVIMKIDRIPLNQNQKVDRRRLPEPEQAVQADEGSNTRDLTGLEKEILEIVSGATGSEGACVSIPLADAGLTSISAMQLIAGLTERFGFSPDASEILNGMSILDIENAVVEDLRRRDRIAREGGQGMENAGGMIKRAPLTRTQLGIYLECRMDEKSDKYNIPLLYKLDKDTDVKRLEEAIYSAVNAHPFMKSSIEPTEDGGADMVSNPELGWAVTIEETRGSDEETEERFKSEPVLFKLSRAPLFDIRIICTDASVYLFIVFHHIIMDGTSVNVFMEDIEAAYQGRELKPETYDSMLLAIDEKKERETDALETAHRVYEGILKGVIFNSLPRGELTPDNDETSHRAAGASYVLEGVDEACVEGFCRDNKVTENAFFTAAFAYMLAKMGDDDEAAFACIHNGRTSAKSLRIMGMLVKTYPFYISFADGLDVCDFVRAVASRIRELTGNELYSFAEAVKDYGVSADVMFAYQGDSFGNYKIGGRDVHRIDMPLKDSKEPLSVDVSKFNGKYTVAFEYREDMYKPDQIVWMAELFTVIAKGFLSGGPLCNIPLLNRQGEAFLDKINDTGYEVPFKPVRCLLEENAGMYPDRTAVIFGDVSLTYTELNRSANRIAHGLIDTGATGKITALILNRSEKVYMVRQGILKAGSAFLSIDPGYPDDRISMMLEDSGAAVLVVDRQFKESRSDFLNTLVCDVTAFEDLLENRDASNPDICVGKDDPAYCIFTSGSTGRPKGVLLTQGNLLNFLDNNPKNPEILGYTQRTHNSLALAAITFDVSVMEEFIPLAHGMTVCMASEEQIHDPAALAEFMIRNKVDMVTATPSFLLSCIGLDVMKDALLNVMSYDLGAEAFPPQLYDMIKAINPDAYIMNGYGPTEATVSCTMEEIKGTENITIGRPAANVKAFIVDSTGRILPPLVPGELVIAGEGVGKGYLARPELTAEKFITMKGLRAYRTGDIAEWTSDGRLRFKGRSDDQVKLRGLRIELSEIENAINGVEGVNTSVVVMRGDEGNAFLAGFYTAGRDISPDEIKGTISRTLTPYMIPGVLMQLDALPLTANGKVDKRKLPDVVFEQDEGVFREPATDAERDFCAWFCEVLHMDKVSADANFFALGGTSLTASVIAMRAKDRGYNVVYADVFKAQTPAALAMLAMGETKEPAGAENDEIKSYDYGKIDLSHNRNGFLPDIRPGDIGSILITGALGFLGVHVLREYLLNYDGVAYCMVRGKNIERRLKSVYFYYFSEEPDKYFESGRIRMISGDITDEETLKTVEGLSFDTLINCAAIVKHFVKDDSLLKTNVGGVKNLINLCRKKGVRLIQTSTVSVAGEGLDGTPAPDKLLYENELYIGQMLDNAYIYSKFLAERAVLEAASEGLDVKVVRLGNLMGRSADGEFQINFRTNAFIRMLASYKSIGAVPYSLINASTDFSEIDMTAQAILKLAGTDRKFNVFHPMNNHSVTYADIVYSMREYGMKIDMVEDDDFAELMKRAGDKAGALIAYSTREGQERRYMLGADCSFTTNALYRLGFKWPVTDEDYIVKMLRALNGMSMLK